MSFLDYIRKFKKFSVIFVPEGTSQRARSIRLSFNAILLIGLIYTIVIAAIGFYSLSLSGANKFLLPDQKGLTDADRVKVNELNSKVIFLVKELEKLKATNERLKYSLILGDSTLFDSLSHTDDSLAYTDEPFFGGNIFLVVKNIFEKLFIQDDNEPFFIKPVNGFISRKFDPERGHMGNDFVVKPGVPVFAAAGGYIVFSDYTINDGYMVIINHSNGYTTIYKHCSVLIKHARESVEQGELVALTGNSGKKTTGPHLHFEIWKDGRPLDPAKVIIDY